MGWATSEQALEYIAHHGTAAHQRQLAYLNARSTFWFVAMLLTAPQTLGALERTLDDLRNHRIHAALASFALALTWGGMTGVSAKTSTRASRQARQFSEAMRTTTPGVYRLGERSGILSRGQTPYEESTAVHAVNDIADIPISSDAYFVNAVEWTPEYVGSTIGLPGRPSQPVNVLSLAGREGETPLFYEGLWQPEPKPERIAITTFRNPDGGLLGLRLDEAVKAETYYRWHDGMNEQKRAVSSRNDGDSPFRPA